MAAENKTDANVNSSNRTSVLLSMSSATSFTHGVLFIKGSASIIAHGVLLLINSASIIAHGVLLLINSATSIAYNVLLSTNNATNIARCRSMVSPGYYLRFSAPVKLTFHHHHFTALI